MRTIRSVVLDKQVGETPLMALSAWKEKNPNYREVPASYAGRLDPMASGKLLILLGDECKRQSSYTTLDKEYEIEVLLDVGSDTGDALGVVSSSGQETRVSEQVVKEALRREIGNHMREYPAYSSKTVNGKPLFAHALEGTLGAITIPTHGERIYRIDLLGMEKITAPALMQRIEGFLDLVPKTDEPSKELGRDFRIQDVRESWKNVFMDSSRSYAIIRLRVACGTGTYMRSLAPRIGAAFQTSALAVSIRRTRIGRYWHGLWLKRY